MKIGAKISLDPERRGEIERIVGIVDFVEVFVKKGNMPASEARELGTRWVVHGPHVSHGVNFSKLTDEGRQKFRDSIVLASELEARYVIVHPGACKRGDDRQTMYEEMIANILEMRDFASQNSVELILENITDEDVYPVHKGMSESPDMYLVSTPGEIRDSTKRLGLDFLMDFSHAAITALHQGRDYKEFVREVAGLKPEMFHICDNKASSPYDMHLPLGRGDYDIAFFASLIGDEDVTLEVTSDHLGGVLPTFDDFKESVDHLVSLGVKFN